ncbi:fatty acid desaturase [Inquilinus sp. Marseille-Q2685]|uniref:fatty acid desaturase n=1 Tax=Inquilinus sp. Marseille-Q2685 TaxID=2866581 RepID=UPI001CE44EC3|nr:fatty acid desaturase [Inquilinus sp. Marseille-Q2685]
MSTFVAGIEHVGSREAAHTARRDPRAEMAERLPAAVQPFLSWLTARPAPQEAEAAHTPMHFVHQGCLLVMAGLSFGVLWTVVPTIPGALLLFISLILTTSGLGVFQVVVFHHCAHGTVFRTWERNRAVGRLISAVFLFKHFDHYRKEHMHHHSARKLLTEEDEFADFVLGMCRLEPELPKRELWRRVLVNVVFSPGFHVRFLFRRIRAAMRSHDPQHNIVAMFALAIPALASALTGHALAFLVIWLLPLTLLLQWATIGRILCEHRFPEPALIAARDKEFVCLATAGVFPGAPPPRDSAWSPAGLAAWCGWWANMLTIQLLVRVIVLVGDAPCHDFHHRRPSTKQWTDYIHARQKDVDAGCPGFPLNYGETWGLFRAIDENLATLSATPKGAVPTWPH